MLLTRKGRLLADTVAEVLGVKIRKRSGIGCLLFPVVCHEVLLVVFISVSFASLAKFLHARRFTFTMNPPPPPAAPVEKQCHISRDGTVLEIWPISALRPMLVSGDFKPNDHFWYEGADGWERLVPEPPVAASPFPYIGDELPFYFIRSELLYGPRTAAEIDILHAQGWLKGDTFITFCGAEQWWTLKEFLDLDDNDAPVGKPQNFDWISHGARAFVGDHIAGAAIGIHVAKRAMAWFAELPSTPPDDSKGKDQ